MANFPPISVVSRVACHAIMFRVEPSSSDLPTLNSWIYLPVSPRRITRVTKTNAWAHHKLLDLSARVSNRACPNLPAPTYPPLPARPCQCARPSHHLCASTSRSTHPPSLQPLSAAHTPTTCALTHPPLTLSSTSHPLFSSSPVHHCFICLSLLPFFDHPHPHT
jgi:hypothetical protein